MYRAWRVSVGAFEQVDDPADERCPVGTRKLEREPHMVDRMAGTVLERGGHLEMVDGPAAEALRPVAEVAALMHSWPDPRRTAAIASRAEAHRRIANRGQEAASSSTRSRPP
jgi:hypothetical protein